MSILDLTIQRVPIDERLTLALDDTPTERYGPEIEGSGRHHNPTPGPSGSKTLYGHNRAVLARPINHAHSHRIGPPLRAGLYVRRRDVPGLPRDVTPREFRTKPGLAAAMLRAAADSPEDRWDGPVWRLTDGGYAERPMFAAARQVG